MSLTPDKKPKKLKFPILNTDRSVVTTNGYEDSDYSMIKKDDSFNKYRSKMQEKHDSRFIAKRAKEEAYNELQVMMNKINKLVHHDAKALLVL